MLKRLKAWRGVAGVYGLVSVLELLIPDPPPDPMMQTAPIIALLAVAIIASVVGTGISIDAQNKAAEATEDAAEAKAAADKRKAYHDDERTRRLRKIHMRALAEGIGKSGIRGDIGTPLDFALDTASELELGALNARQTSLYNAEVGRVSGINAAAGMRLNAVATGFSGVAQAASIGLSGATALGSGGGTTTATATTTG